MTEDSSTEGVDQPHRRRFLAGGALATGAMASGLALGYGMFFRSAGQYLYPADEGTAWMFVTNVASLPPGQALTFQSPTGVPVVVTRRSTDSADDELTADDFLALSSVCPHLGCRVHWEPQHNRFFCPCHLGTFDPQGYPTGGPPLAANQSLPHYPLKVEEGLLYINMPVEPIDPTSYRRLGKSDFSEQEEPNGADSSGKPGETV